jgi:release factor glutamine methyltransferase
VTARRPGLAGVTVRDALDSALVALTAAGCDSPRLDAELLLAAALGADRAALIADPARELEPAQAREFQALVVRRREREPVAYILGRRAFRHIDLAVDERVLIPRPESELLVEVALELPAGARVLDVGTGSGAVALALKQERPDLDVTGSDSDPGALEVARGNAQRLGLEVGFVAGDLLDGPAGPWDAVLSNPPYVPESEAAALAPEIVKYEPRGALFAGPDGLAVIRRLVEQATGVGLLAVEVGAGQAEAVETLARAASFAAVERRHDLAGHERVVVARTR